VFLAELEYALEEASIACAEPTGPLALLDQHAQLFGRVHAVRFRARALDAHRANDGACARVQDEVERARDPREGDERGGDPAARGFWMRNGPRLGYQLAEYDVQIGNRCHRDDRRDAPPCQEVEPDRERGKPVAEEMGDGILG